MELILNNNFLPLTEDNLSDINGGRDAFSYICEWVFVGGVAAGVTALTGGSVFFGVAAGVAAQQFFEAQPAY